MATTSFNAFADDLDALIDKYRDERWRISRGEVVGALMFVAWKLMQEAYEEPLEEDGE